jgi:diaminopimelate decarboxylase
MIELTEPISPSTDKRAEHGSTLTTSLYSGELHALVDEVLAQRMTFIQAAQAYSTPQYLVEEVRINAQAERFLRAFATRQQPTRTHYALKANPTLSVVQTVQRAGLCADASSGLELELALHCGFDHIVLSGPAKSDAELDLALAHAEQVTIHLDSFAEMERLERRAAKRQQPIVAGIRLNTEAHGNWTKFGIPAAQLPEFIERARALRWVELRGVQFHLSWNRTAEGYLRTLETLGPLLRDHVPQGGWHFVDIGGGFYPEEDEAAYPWLTDANRLRALSGEQGADAPVSDWDLRYLLHRVQPIEEMAAEILAAFARHITDSLGAVDLWLEPGRYIANKGVHLLLQVVDIKGDGIAITDGGTNLLGWERLEAEHCPLINLSHPATTQKRCRIYGSLCTPHDLWGYAYYGTSLEVGDILLLPAQGSYVQTLAQRFIKPLCQTIYLNATGALKQVERAETLTDRYPALASE